MSRLDEAFKKGQALEDDEKKELAKIEKEKNRLSKLLDSAPSSDRSLKVRFDLQRKITAKAEEGLRICLLLLGKALAQQAAFKAKQAGAKTIGPCVDAIDKEIADETAELNRYLAQFGALAAVGQGNTKDAEDAMRKAVYIMSHLEGKQEIRKIFAESKERYSRTKVSDK